MLLMKKEYFAAIRAGTKTTTLRFWRRPMVRPGDVQTVRGLGRVRIDAVRRVDFAELTEADAQADGFDSVQALREALQQHYAPEQREGRSLYQVHFAHLDACPGRAES